MGNKRSLVYGYDGTYSVRGVFQANDSSSVARFEYGPFGESITAAGPEAAANVYGFSTKRQNKPLSCLYYGLRFYEPINGNWACRDLIGEFDSPNTFSFVRNDPLSSFDPWGLWTVNGVLCFLCNPTDSHVVKELNAIRTFSFTTAFDSWRYVDGHTEREELRSLWGNTKREGEADRPNIPVIRVRASLTDNEAAAVFAHESGHLRRPDPTTKAEYLKQEVDVRVETEWFRKRHGLPPTAPNYLYPDGTVNRQAIESDILSSPHYNPQGRERIGRDYEGDNPESGWVCPITVTK